MTGRHEGRPAADRADASMSLLNEVVRNPLEPEYAQAAAEGRAAAGLGQYRVTVVVLAALIGVLTTAAVLVLRSPQPSTVEARELLEQEIRERTAEAEELSALNDQLDAEISELQNQALESQDPDLLAVLAQDELVAGTVPVVGPGLVIVLYDAPAGEDGERDPESRVQDVDLQIVVNGLWAAGAEAVAINDHRLTAMSAIRSAGEAVLVDLAPLVPPYRVSAVGDARALQTGLARTAAARHLALLNETYGIRSEIAEQERVELPGAAAPLLRFAQATAPMGSGAPTQQEGPGADVASSAANVEGGPR